MSRTICDKNFRFGHGNYKQPEAGLWFTVAQYCPKLILWRRQLCGCDCRIWLWRESFHGQMMQSFRLDQTVVTVHFVHSNLCTEIAKTAISRMSVSGLSRRNSVKTPRGDSEWTITNRDKFHKKNLHFLLTNGSVFDKITYVDCFEYNESSQRCCCGSVGRASHW